MSPAGRLAVALITPSATIYEGEADMVVVPAWDGEVGIMRGHAPMMALLGEGTLRITRDGREESFQVAGGFMQVVDDVVSVLSDTAERT